MHQQRTPRLRHREFICIYIYMYVYICIYNYVNTHIYIYIEIYIQICIYIYTHMYIHTSLHIHSMVYLYKHIFTAPAANSSTSSSGILMYIYICIQIYSPHQQPTPRLRHQEFPYPSPETHRQAHCKSQKFLKSQLIIQFTEINTHPKFEENSPATSRQAHWEKF